jgi:Zn-dependent M28 family amino/carboxypeptidase
VERELVLLGLGGTVGTPAGGITAEIVAVASLAEIDTRGAELAGKIVLINQAMPDYDHERRESGYGTTVRIRSSGASSAARHGARAVLIRSVTANSLRTPHTGALSYDEGVPKIPAAAVTPSDAQLLVRMAARGPTKVKLELGARTLKDAESGNAIGELPGRELPEEVVLIGGHIDSWDVGDGSTDDGSGCIMVMEAARLLAELGLRPRRTIRVVLFTNEENGLRGARAYHEAHRTERHAAAFEADSGAGAPWGIGIGGTAEQVAALQRYVPLFAAFGVEHLAAGGGGADIGPLMRDGVLGLGLRPDGSRYFDLHHSPADMVDKIAPEHLQKNAAAIALMAFILAEIDLPAAPPDAVAGATPAAESAPKPRGK